MVGEGDEKGEKDEEEGPTPHVRNPEKYPDCRTDLIGGGATTQTFASDDKHPRSATVDTFSLTKYEGDQRSLHEEEDIEPVRLQHSHNEMKTYTCQIYKCW